jgi:GTPase Era involved in 16S rRNA processing
MAYDYSDLVDKTKQWIDSAVANGWLSQSIAQQLLDFDQRSPSSLFNALESRPLIVAFMGGTGVGKSSLINRLAGSAIAKAGVERPTSKEVTLFHHRDIVIKHLPAQLPIEQIKIAQHDDDSKKSIIWIDMPDFDSTVQSNKQQVLQWLPHIDVLIYVVSPERYRDEKAWRLLLAEGGKHAWLFVLNQWDRGQIEQLADFRQQLHKAGFADPVIFTTSCTDMIANDEFSVLESTLSALANDHTINQLEQRGNHLKIQELLKKLHDCQQLLGSGQSAKQLEQIWNAQWQQTSTILQQGFAWPMQKIASYYAEHAADLIGKTTTETALWDSWAQARLDDALDEVAVNASQSGLSAMPYKNALSPARTKASKIIQNQTELAVRQALLKPGHAFQRFFLKFVHVCELILPLVAICWVGYQVFIGYYHSNMTSSNYLGVDFAIHSALLIALTWLLPFFILKKFKPSLEKSALRGLNKGLASGLSSIEAEVLLVLHEVEQSHINQSSQLTDIINQCQSSAETSPTIPQNQTLSRMLVN